jgi:hypothetical protein
VGCHQPQLTSEDKLELESLLCNSPILRIAHELKEEIVRIYNSNTINRRGAESAEDINKKLIYSL